MVNRRFFIYCSLATAASPPEVYRRRRQISGRLPSEGDIHGPRKDRQLSPYCIGVDAETSSRPPLCISHHRIQSFSVLVFVLFLPPFLNCHFHVAPFFCIVSFVASSTLQWATADAEIKVPSVENTELKGSPFKAGLE